MRARGIVIAACASVAYATEAVVSYLHYGDESFDLAIANHTIWQWSRFELPANPIQGFPHELGDHFSPIYALLAPIYWVVQDPIALLVVQALLLGASAIPVLRFAERRLDRLPALILTLAYALFWGIWAGNESGFHEYAFAPLLLALALDWADLRRWRGTWACVALLLLVKEDIGLVVAAFGVYLMLTGARRQGLIAVAVGVVAFALVNGVLMPAFADGQTSTTFRRVYGGLGGTPGAAARHVAEHPLSTLGTMFQHAKVHLLLLLFGAFALLPLLSPVTLIAVPGIAERLLAGPPQYYLPQYHYTLLVASLLAMAAADGLARLRRWLPARWGESVALGLTGAALMISVGNSVTSPPLDIFKPSSYRRTAFDRAADAAVARVPDGAAVGASIPLLARVSAREHVYSVEAGKRRAQWLLLSGPEVAAEVPAGWRMVYARKGVALLRATSVGGAAQLGALDLPAGGLG